MLVKTDSCIPWDIKEIQRTSGVGGFEKSPAQKSSAKDSCGRTSRSELRKRFLRVNRGRVVAPTAKPIQVQFTRQIIDSHACRSLSEGEYGLELREYRGEVLDLQKENL